MANVITSFLVGIGLDVSDFESGEKKVTQSMDRIKSSTLGIGAAMASAVVGAGIKVDQMAEKSRKLQDQLYRTNTSPVWAQGYGVALTELGGNADEASGRIVDLENKLSSIKMGQGGDWLRSLGAAGFDASALSRAKNASEFINLAADQFSKVQGDSLATVEERRRNMASVLGLTDAEFKLWQQGGKYVDEHSRQLATQLGYTEELNTKQYEYSQAWKEVNLELDKASNTLGVIMLDDMTSLVNKAKEYTSTFNDFTQKNPEETKSALEGGMVVAGGLTLSSIGAMLSKFGIPGAAILRGAGPVATAAGISIATEPWVDKGLNSVFGGSEYYQNLRTAPTWDEFGQALIGQRETTPEVQKYVERRQDESETTRKQVQQNLPTWNAYQSGQPSRLPYWLEPSEHHQATPKPSDTPNPTQGADYAPSAYERSDYNAAAVGDATAGAVSALPPVRVENKVTMTGTVELDGRQVGEIIDVKIDEHNQQAAAQYNTGVSR